MHEQPWTGIAQSGWQRHFARATLGRGAAYASEGNVLALHPLDGDGRAWAGEVLGSEDAPYACEVRLVLDAQGQATRVESGCTCPVGSLCKHAAALLWALEMESQGSVLPPPEDEDPREPEPAQATGDPLREWRPWLARFEPMPSAAQPSERGTPDLGLLLRPSPHHEPAELRVAVVQFRRGRHGQRVDPRPLLLEDPHAPLPGEGWTEATRFALALLIERQSERIGAITYAQLEDAIEDQAFETLLGQLPAFWERGSQPLARGPARSLALHWEDLPDGRQRLTWHADDQAALQVLRAWRWWYVEPSRARVGRIANPEVLELARRAPLLAPEHTEALRERLLALVPGHAARLPPLPQVRARPRQIVAAPHAVLHLAVFEPRPYHAAARERPASVGLAQLGFDYGGERVGVGGAERERRLRRGELVEVVRDRAAERALMQTLHAHGLILPRGLPWPTSYSYATLDESHRVLVGPERQPLAAAEWADTLRTLQAQGVLLEYGAGFPRPLREIDVDTWEAGIDGGGSSWFELSLGVDVEGRRIDLLPVLRTVLADPTFPLQPGADEAADARWRVEIDEQRALRLPLARLRELLGPLLDWLQQDAPGLRLHRSQTDTLRRLAAVVHWRGAELPRSSLAELRAHATQADAPEGFLAELRGYQREGLAWLDALASAGLGGILADDMGLGKTVQVLAHLLREKARLGAEFRTLVVAPTSLVGNWRDEAARFAPALRVLVLHGPTRTERWDEISRHDLIITTYPLLGRDRDRLVAHAFSLLVLDEAQAIKNARSVAAQVVRELHASRRLAMTGTPLENHLGELWAQFDAVEPGLLGSERDFNRLFRTPIEKHGDRERQDRLQRRIGALLLRRRKDEVLKELPPKTDIVRVLELEGGQRELYESLRLAQHERVRQAVAERGLAQSGIVVLDALLKLRQVCCDPRLVGLAAARKVKESAKLDALLELLDTLLAEDRRVLLFSQFTSMLDLIEPALGKRRVPFLRLSGDTPAAERSERVRRFQEGEVPLFLISLKAGGVGLNLTAADSVIHYDPWWNPAAENQATDRAHRIGQDKPVFVYKLICAGTVEEKILSLQERKAALAQAVLEGGRSTSLRFDEEDLSALFAPLG